MSLYYDVNTAPALKNLNMTIEPGMKVGIVGRFVDFALFCRLQTQLEIIGETFIESRSKYLIKIVISTK